jgi:transposase
VRELIETRGCELIFLPAYSPHFCAIEEAFSKVKMLLKKAACRTTREAHPRGFSGGDRSGTGSGQYARRKGGYIAHCGYRVEAQCSSTPL